jgi:hypothetical protein
MRTVSCYSPSVTSISANDVRIPARARGAIAKHERVVVLNHGRPAFVITNPDDLDTGSRPAPHGRPLREAAAVLAAAGRPDRGFTRDLEHVLASVGAIPVDPWEPS